MMARPVRDGKEKACVISVSCTPEEKMFLEMKGISPSKLFQDAIFNLKSNIQNKPSVFEVENDIAILRKYYVAGTKPNGDREIYLKAVNMFLQKYPDWTKAEVMARAERPLHVNIVESKDDERDETL